MKQIIWGKKLVFFNRINRRISIFCIWSWRVYTIEIWFFPLAHYRADTMGIHQLRKFTTKVAEYLNRPKLDRTQVGLAIKRSSGNVLADSKLELQWCNLCATFSWISTTVIKCMENITAGKLAIAKMINSKTGRNEENSVCWRKLPKYYFKLIKHFFGNCWCWHD